MREVVAMANVRERRGDSIRVRLQQAAGHYGARKASDYALVLMLAAVARAICKIADTIIDLGRSAGWWQ